MNVLRKKGEEVTDQEVLEEVDLLEEVEAEAEAEEEAEEEAELVELEGGVL